MKACGILIINWAVKLSTILEKMCWELGHLVSVILYRIITHNKCHFYTLIFRQCSKCSVNTEPFSKTHVPPHPLQSMLRGSRSATNRPTWRLSTLYRGRGGVIKTLLLKCPNTFFQDCSYFKR